MTLPISNPNETAKSLIHPNRRDNNWGEAVNANLYTLASKADEYRDTVRSDVIELERRVASQFQALIDFINGSVADYGFQMGAARFNIIKTIKAYIQSKLSIVVNELIVSTKGSLAAINEMEETLLLQINRLQTEFNLLEGQILSETDRTLALVDSETRETNAVKDEIVQRVKAIRNKLTAHVTNKEDPHSTNSANLDSNSVYYQPDPVGDDAIQPHSPFDVLNVNTPTDSELRDLEAEITAPIVPIGELDASTLSALWVNLLTKYLVLDGTALNAPGTYFRFGGALGYGNNGIATVNAVDPTGDLLVVSDATGDPNVIKLTWDSTATRHQPGDFITLDFGTINPIEGGTVIVKFYPQGAPLTAPASTFFETITKLRYLNAPVIVNGIFSHEAITATDPDPELNIQAAVLNFYDDTSAVNVRPILSWTPAPIDGESVWSLNLLINSDIATPIAPLFDIPRLILNELRAISGLEGLNTWPAGYFNAQIGNRKFVGYADPTDDNNYMLVSQPDGLGNYYKLEITVDSPVTPIVHDELLSVTKVSYNDISNTTLITSAGTIKTYEPPYVSSSS